MTPATALFKVNVNNETQPRAITGVCSPGNPAKMNFIRSQEFDSAV